MRGRQTGNTFSGSDTASSSQSNSQHSSPGQDSQNGHDASRITRSNSSNSAKDHQHRPPVKRTTDIRATYTGKILIITGLQPQDFPPPKPESPEGPRGRKPRGTNGSQYQSPSKRGVSSVNGSPIRRAGAKRKRPGAANGDTGSFEDEFLPSGSQNSLANGYNHDADEDATVGTNGVSLDDVVDPSPTKRRRRGVRSQLQSEQPSKAPSPELAILGPDEDLVEEDDLPLPFELSTPTPDPEDLDDEAQRIYKSRYKPLTKAAKFLAQLTKFNPAQRSDENLYAIAENTAYALRLWQDEYLRIDKLTAHFAPIQRRPATANRNPIDPTIFEDMKEADLYDYVYDPKKPGYQDAIAQRVIRDPSGRELRHRQQRGRTGADTQLVKAAAMSEEDGGRRQRNRKPVSKYDGVLPEDQQRRKRGLDYAESEQPAKRGRTWARGGRGSRGGRGGRGGSLLDKRIREIREASADFSTASTSGDDDTASEAGGLAESAYNESREGSLVPPNEEDDAEPAMDGGLDTAAAEAAAIKRKGRPKGSKNLHARSDKGIPKGPRNKPKDATPPAETPPPAAEPTPPLQAEEPSPSPVPTSTTGKANKKGQAPKSEKRSQSMTEWWARRKAAQTEAKAAAQAAAAATANTKGTPMAPAPPAPQQQQAPPLQPQYPGQRPLQMHPQQMHPDMYMHPPHLQHPHHPPMHPGPPHHPHHPYPIHMPQYGMPFPQPPPGHMSYCGMCIG